MAFGKADCNNGPVDEMIIYMGKGVEIKGDIRFDGSGRIDGKVDGKIKVKGSLVLGEGADISSEIDGDHIIVGGKVSGRIVGHQKVQLLKSSVVSGEIVTPSLTIEEGAQFNGTSKMTKEVGATSTVTQTDEETKRPIVMAVK
ncbi:MAG: polymer-forming cytoskeletal protein [Nitrospira sp.]